MEGGGGGGGDFVLLTMPAFPPSVVSSFFIQSKVGKGGSGVAIWARLGPKTSI